MSYEQGDTCLASHRTISISSTDRTIHKRHETKKQKKEKKKEEKKFTKNLKIKLKKEDDKKMLIVEEESPKKKTEGIRGNQKKKNRVTLIAKRGRKTTISLGEKRRKD